MFSHQLLSHIVFPLQIGAGISRTKQEENFDHHAPGPFEANPNDMKTAYYEE
jgi:hypothetical protein